jgi:hypothetical protein
MSANLLRRVFVHALKLALVAAAVFYLLASGRLQLADLRLAGGAWPWIVVALSITLVATLLSFARYWFILRAGGVESPLSYVTSVGFIGSFVNGVFFGGFGFYGGDAVRIGYLGRKTGRWTEVISATVVDRVVGLAGLLILAIAGLQLAPPAAFHSPAFIGLATTLYLLCATLAVGLLVTAAAILFGTWLAALLAVGFVSVSMLAFDRFGAGLLLPLLLLVSAACGGLLTAAIARSGWLLDAVASWPVIGRRLSAALNALLRYRNAAGTLLLGLSLAVLIHFLTCLSFYSVAQALAIPSDPTLAQMLFAGPPANALTALPLPAGALGISETGFDTLLRLWPTPEGTATTGGAAIFLAARVVTILISLIGLPAFLLNR